MNANSTERGFRADDIARALAPHGFDAERPIAGAVVMAMDRPLRVVWANRAATTLFGSDEADDLSAQVLTGRGRGGLGEALQRLSLDAPPRFERLRLIKGFRSRTLTVSTSRTILSDGRPIFVLAVPVHDLGDAAPADVAVSALRWPAGHPMESAGGDDLDTADAAVEDRRPSVPAPVESGPPVEGEPSIPPVAGPPEPARLIWQTDSEHRLTRLAEGRPAMAGLDDPARVLACPFVNLIASGDGRDRLASALQAGTPFNGLPALWPLAGGTAAVPILLAGVPVVRGPGGFGGFRGFGVADLSQRVPLAPAPAVIEPDGPLTPVLSDEPLPSGLPDEDLSTPAAPEPIGFDDTAGAGASLPPEAAAEARPERPTMPASYPRPITFSSKVVALRPYHALAAAAHHMPTASASDLLASPHDTPSADRPTPDPEMSAGILDLSSAERDNFDAIGRHLQVGDPLQAMGDPLQAAGDDDDRPSFDLGSSAAAEFNAQSILDHLDVAVLVTAEDRLAYANPALLSLTGYDSLDALRHAGGLPHLLAGLDLQQVADGPVERAFPIVDVAGEVVAVEGRCRTIGWTGSPATLLTLRRVPTTDAPSTPVDRAEARRHDDDDLADYRNIVAALSEAVATVDLNGRLLSFNAAAERLFGLPQGSAIGQSITALLGPQSQGTAIAALAGAVGPSAAAPVEVTGRTASGAVLNLQMRLRSIGPGKLCVTWRDSAELVQLHQEVQQATRDLDEARAMKSDFLAKVSHEVRTPLNAILGFTEVILDERFGPIGNQRYKDYLNDIHASGSHVMRLVADLLDLSKMEAGRTAMEPTAIDANRVVGECVAELQTTAHRERVIMRLSMMPRLPSVFADERAFRQVVANVLSNAIKFNEPGGQVIVSTAVNETGAVAVRVRDTGVGMSDAEIAMAMEPFRQINTGRNGGGNGLGLPLTRALVEANGATMSIKSRKDEGTLVEIVFRAFPAEAIRVPAE